MQLSVIRSPARGGSPTKTKFLRMLVIPIPSEGHIEMRFGTGGEERQSSYYAPIGEGRFAELAQAMIKANPQAAIRAFGAAMQSVEIAKPK